MKYRFAAIVAMLLVASSSFGQQRVGSENQDVTKFCFYAGTAYTKGAVIVDQSKQELICVVDPESPNTLPPHERRLMWESKKRHDNSIFR